jgi:DNA primase
VPGIDFDRLRHEITMEQVLSLVGFEPTRRNGDQWYGRCPFHESTGRQHPSFSVNVAMRVYYCHKCQSKGNQLQLWAAYTQMEIRPATIDLCHEIGREVPWIWRC